MSTSKIKGKIIKEISLDSSLDQLNITFTDGWKLTIWDGMQMCCEERYLHCDDDLPSFVGSMIVDIEERDGPDDVPNTKEIHETKFIHVITNGGTIVLCCHNEHDGSYTGFTVSYKATDPTDPGGNTNGQTHNR